MQDDAQPYRCLIVRTPGTRLFHPLEASQSIEEVRALMAEAVRIYRPQGAAWRSSGDKVFWIEDGQECFAELVCSW